ncbi:MAG: mechanosensitive ion channel, partial [Bacteroidia bacterium]|nr:mechanosensitive ion channel [Bacteroidia bacterium]
MDSEYLRFIIIVIASFVTAFAFRFFLNTYIKKLTEKTETDTDDIILSIFTSPSFTLIVVTGLYFAVNSLTFLERYTLTIDRTYFVILIFVITYVISRVLSFLVSRWLHVERKIEKTPRLINRVVVVFVYLISFLMVLKKFNVEITPLIATLGIGGLAIGLALQSTLSNFFAGLNIISDNPFRVGDFIELNESN